MGVMNRAIRNISRRKIRALLVIIALGFSMAILVTIPAGVLANQKTANNITTGLSGAINQTGQSINQTESEIDVSLASGLSGFGFSPPSGGSGTTIGGYGGYGGGGTGGSSSGRTFFRSFGAGQPSMMNYTLYSGISNITGVAAVEPELEVYEGSHNETVTAPAFGGSSSGRTFTESVPDYIIEGVPLTTSYVDTYSMLPTNITAGQNLQVGETGDVLLSQSSASYFGVTVGQTVTIENESFTVVGIVGNSAISAFGATNSKMVYMNLSDAQTITDNDGNVTSLVVYAQNPDLVSSVTSSINTDYPELSATSLSSTSLSTSGSNSVSATQEAADALNSSNQTAVEEIVIVIAATSLIVLFVMLYTVRERTREIGTLKAIGFSNATVMSQFLFEGIVLSIISGAVGVGIGVVAAPKLASLLVPMNLFGSSGAVSVGTRFTSAFTASVTVSPELIAIVFGAAVALGALGSLYPAWRAAKIKPAEAMRYE